MTSGSILTGIRSALIDIFLTQLTTEPINTQALEISDPIQTRPTVVTWRRRAVVSVDQTVASFVTFSAATFITAVRINASGTVSARIVLTLVYVVVTITSGKTERAGAEIVPVVCSWCTCCSVGTLARLAWIHFSFASFTSVWRFTDAHEVVDQVDAGAAVFAGGQLAVVNVHFAVLSGKAFCALAGVGVEMCAAFSAVLARVGLAEV